MSVIRFANECIAKPEVSLYPDTHTYQQRASEQPVVLANMLTRHSVLILESAQIDRDDRQIIYPAMKFM